MQTMEGTSTEKRLDDLNDRMAEGFGRVHREIDGLTKQTFERFQRVEKEMSEGFQRVDGDIRELRGDIKDLRAETNERFAAVDARFESVEARFDAMHRTMMRGFFALGGIVVTLFLALAGLQGF
jgi:hypothetical protein